MIRKRFAALLVSLVFAVMAGTSPLFAAAHTKGSKGSSKSGSSRSGSGKSSKGRTSTGKTVHVKGYTKKDGTQVSAHDRKAPQSRTSKPKTMTTATRPTAAPRTNTASTTWTSSTATRNGQGRIERSAAAKHAFEIQTGYPHGRFGYVVDHIKPLACGGADAPSNMQWQTIEAAKAKDKVERIGCR